MNFQATYYAEVLQSRRTRSQRAHFWAKVIGIVLMITIGATLRSEPQLRQAILTAGMDGVMAMTGKEVPASQGQTALPHDTAAIQSLMAEASRMQTAMAAEGAGFKTPIDAVKVNRHGSGHTSNLHFHSVARQHTSAIPPKVVSAELSQILNAMKTGH